MAAKWRSAGVVLFCALLMAQGVRAENCRLSVSQPRLDYGVIRREAVVQSTSVALGTRTLHLNVVCTQPSMMALRFIGAADGQGFRFDRQGRMRLSLKHAQVDGRTVEWGVAHLPGETVSGALLPGQVLVARAAGQALVGQRLTAQVDVDIDLPSDALQVRDETRLEGQGTFELV
ncbi:hypothetical protein, partial [Pseudomonas sp. GW704-E2]